MNAIFLDRDGVVNEYPGDGEYVTSWKRFKFINGSKKAIKLLNEHDYDVYIISNQAGVSHGIYKQKTLDLITRNMLVEIKKSGANIKKVLYCTHTKDDNCDCRKPKTGLFVKAVGDLKEGFREVYFIGDDKRDVETGRNVGCKTILVFSGKSKKKDLDDWEFLPDGVANNLLEAVKKIVLRRKEHAEAL